MTGETDNSKRQAIKQMAASALRRSGLTGKAWWRSLGDYADTPEFTQWAQNEFPALAQELSQQPAGTSRRTFLQLMAASMALAGLGLSGCRRPEGKIRPYNQKPADMVLGKGTYYASTFVLAGRATGVLVETHEGRPTKIEGNPKHPNSLGATDLFAQASILDLYDPDRSRNFLHKGSPASREQFNEFAAGLAKQLQANKGKGFAILSEDYASPSIDMLFEHVRKTLPEAQVYVYDPIRWLLPPLIAINEAEVIASLDCDFLGTEDIGAKYRQGFAARRRVDGAEKMSRLYVAEPCPTVTGASADHRLRIPAAEIAGIAKQLLAAVQGTPATGPHAAWIDAAAEDLRAAGGRGVVLAGGRQWTACETAGVLNSAIGSHYANYDATGIPQRAGVPGGLRPSLEWLVPELRKGNVQTLLILGGNPAYTAPADFDLGQLLQQIPTTIRLGLFEDETSVQCTWHVPAAHYLESWGDARTYEGLVSAVQPMIEPLWGGVSPLETLARITGYPTQDPYEIVRARFGSHATGANWPSYLQGERFDGISGGVMDVVNPPMPWDHRTADVTPSADNIEICFAPDAKVFDGRFANNGWLQECPDPITKLTWDNAALLSPTTAKHFGIDTGHVIKIELDGRSIESPVYVLPGTADWSITLPLGYGRTRGGSLAVGAGFNAYALRTSKCMGFGVGAKISKTGKTYPLATTQEHWAMDLQKHLPGSADEQARERAIIREGSADQYARDPAFAKRQGEHAPIRLNIYAAPKLDGANQWGMTIDLSACVGCNACVMACQAENNVPIVGKNEVIRGREMHWLRIDRYFGGSSETDAEPILSVQPMACQQCEAAPCEPVCPVNATVHSPEGLNEMVYNRCIGTRYCSNNCPYKVRRFNFYDWNKGTIRADTAPTRDGNLEPNPQRGFSKPQSFQTPLQETLKMQENPNVTVRMRGVMEKCTYCVQRIEMAKIDVRSKVGQGAANAVVDGKPAVKVPDGLIQTACQQVCPTRAITFGDVSDPQSKVSQQLKSPRAYEVLEHLNVKPRTRYLARIRNLNPKLSQE